MGQPNQGPVLLQGRLDPELHPEAWEAIPLAEQEA